MKRKWQAVVSGERVEWADAVIASLMEAGFDVEVSGSWADVTAAPRRAQPDVLVLLAEAYDVELLDACRAVSSGTPLAVVVVGRDVEETFAVDGLEAGADDFIAWPVSSELLGARVRAVLRRGERSGVRYGPIKVRDLTVNLLSHEVTMLGRRVDLTPTEFRILACMARNAGQVIPSRVLLREAQGYDCDEHEAQDIVKVHIRRLRNKLEPNPNTPSYIINVRGFGYILERRALDRRAPTARFA